jgi:hypothetical protein
MALIWWTGFCKREACRQRLPVRPVWASDAIRNPRRVARVPCPHCRYENEFCDTELEQAPATVFLPAGVE